MREKPAPRSRFSRNLKRAAILIVIVAGVVALLQFVALPRFARSRINALLGEMGVHDAQFTLRRATLRSVEIGDVRLGQQPWFTADALRVRFDPVTLLLSGRFDTVDATGVTYRVAARDGAIDWGFHPPPSKDESGDPFNFQTIRLEDCRVVVDAGGAVIDTPIDGALAAIEGNALKADIQAHLFHQPVQIAATIAAPNLQIQARIAEIALTDGDALASSVPALNGVVVTGRYSLDADIRIEDGRMVPLITLRAAEAAIAHPDWPVALVSAAATLEFDSLSPLRTRGAQRLNIARATTGELEVIDGQVLFNLESPEALHIDHGAWTFADGGGHFTTGGFTVNPREPRIIATIAAVDVDLNFWLKLLTNERSDGQGRLRGEFSVDWNPRAYPRIQFTGGLLVADPPTGFVRARDAQRLGAMLDESNPELAIDETLRVVKQRIVDALEDFAYTLLRLEFVPDGRDSILRAELQGKGRRGPNPQEFSGLVINFHHFADALQNVLNARSAISSMRDQTRERLESLE